MLLCGGQPVSERPVFICWRAGPLSLHITSSISCPLQLASAPKSSPPSIRLPHRRRLLPCGFASFKEMTNSGCQPCPHPFCFPNQRNQPSPSTIRPLANDWGLSAAWLAGNGRPHRSRRSGAAERNLMDERLAHGMKEEKQRWSSSIYWLDSIFFRFLSSFQRSIKQTCFMYLQARS